MDILQQSFLDEARLIGEFLLKEAAGPYDASQPLQAQASHMTSGAAQNAGVQVASATGSSAVAQTKNPNTMRRRKGMGMRPPMAGKGGY